MEMRIERVVLETDQNRIVGDLHMPREGYRSRLSDYLNRSDGHFVALSNVEVESLDGERSRQQDFIAVGRAHVKLAYLAKG